MTTFHRDHHVNHARCAKDDHDLVIRRSDAKCYCTNSSCVFYRKPHPTGSMTNTGFSARKTV